MRTSIFVALATLLMTIQPFAVKFSQTEDGRYEYLVLSTVVLTELAKLLVSLFFYVVFVKPTRRTHNALSRREIASFAVPALVYALNNALVFAIVADIRPSSFQILSAFKTVFTLVLFRLVLKKIPTSNQYVAVLLLAAGAAVSRLSSVEGCIDESRESDGGALGVVLTLVSCLASSVGGISNELLLKKDGGLHPLSLQNALLYGFGVVVNSVALLIRNGSYLAAHGFFDGYDGRTIILILINTITGISISAVLKFGNNILRVYAHSGAMLLSMTVEMLAFGLPASFELFLAAVIVSGSALIYANDPPPRPAKPPPTLLNSQISVQLRASNAEV